MTDVPDPADAVPATPVKAKGERERHNARWAAAGAAAMGIGSAALVAALLYANRDKKKAAPKPEQPKHAPESD